MAVSKLVPGRSRAEAIGLTGAEGLRGGGDSGPGDGRGGGDGIRGGRPGGSDDGRSELARQVMRVLKANGTGLKPLSYRQASMRCGGELHFTIIGNMATGLGASPQAARRFAAAFDEDEELFGALAAGVPLSSLRSDSLDRVESQAAAMDTLSRLGVEVSMELFRHVPLRVGEVSLAGKIITGDAEGGDVGFTVEQSGQSGASVGGEVAGQVEAIQLRGNSLAPDYNDGDILLVRRTEKVRVGQVAVVVLGTMGSPQLCTFGKDEDGDYMRSRHGEIIRGGWRVTGVLVGFIRLLG